MQSGSGSNGSKDYSILSGSVKSDINVTPLVDVCLVLLIIFMVVTPLLQKGVDVAMPETSNPEKIPEGAKQLTIAVKLDGNAGKVFIGDNWVPNEILLKELKSVYDQSPDKVVVIKGDRRLKYKEIRRVMEITNQAGFAGVGLITTRKQTSGGGG